MKKIPLQAGNPGITHRPRWSGGLFLDAGNRPRAKPTPGPVSNPMVPLLYLRRSARYLDRKAAASARVVSLKGPNRFPGRPRTMSSEPRTAM